MAKYYSPTGNLEVWGEKPENYYTVEEWQEMHPAPEPPEPTKDEKMAILDSEYEQAKADIFEAYQTAVLMGDVDLQTSIQADFAELNADYAEERAAIING
jgi:hypothetical protein